MMEQAIREILMADATVAALAGARVEPGFLSQENNATVTAEERQPTITYFQVSSEHPSSQSGSSGIKGGHYYLDCWAATYALSKELGKATLDALHGYSGVVTGAVVQGAFAAGGSDSYEDSSRLWRYRIDLTIWGKED